MKNNITLQVGVKALLKSKEGRYLMLRRSLSKYPEIQGRWDITGGRIDIGKNLLENLKREVKEETGLELVGEPKLIAAQDILRDSRHIVRLTYVGEVEGDVRLDKEEHDTYQWCTRDELCEMEDVDVYFKELLNKGIVWQER
ncbi:NUDIX domain-containing protein [Patescibacteria group bacterium]|nr:NUDIX domain-containing protein [Patescibacteria group bacterium]